MNESNKVTLTTHPPAKLNLFLELLGKRPDGFHEIDTVMMPIDWCDTLTLTCRDQPEINLNVELESHGTDATKPPNKTAVATADDTKKGDATPAPDPVPSDERNLVYQALRDFKHAFDLSNGFLCKLVKRIPAGAGLGGASSDAASALVLAAKLHGIDPSHPHLLNIAKNLGSDIPFFLGCPEQMPDTLTGSPRGCRAARGTGRGEIIEPIDCPISIDFVVVFPCTGLSTPAVYARSAVPQEKRGSQLLRTALSAGKNREIPRLLWNRLESPAKKLAPGIGIAIESMQYVGLSGCQMTGSGSACFGIAEDELAARRFAHSLKEQLGPQYIVQVSRSTEVPGLVN